MTQFLSYMTEWFVQLKMCGIISIITEFSPVREPEHAQLYNTALK